MTFGKLAIAIVAATGIAATSIVLTYSTGAPAAVPGTQDARAAARPAAVDAALPRRSEAANRCARAVWPYVPASCIRNASPERAGRAVRIIPIHTISRGD